jgi:hypothetical protein
MKLIPTFIAITALPLMALGQTADQQQDASKAQTNETQKKATPKKKKARAAQESTKPQAGSVKKTETETHSSKTQTKVNKQEFKSRHREVFTLGRHPKEFFAQRYGANHFRLIGNTYFVFVDRCWVAVDVVGVTFVERMICEGDPDFVVVY